MRFAVCLKKTPPGVFEAYLNPGFTSYIVNDSSSLSLPPTPGLVPWRASGKATKRELEGLILPRIRKNFLEDPLLNHT